MRRITEKLAAGLAGVGLFVFAAPFAPFTPIAAIAPVHAARPRPGVVTGTVRLYEQRGGERRRAASSAGVVVYVPGARGPAPVTVRRKPVRLTLRDRELWPEVVPVVVGGQVEIRNRDGEYHEPFSRSQGRPFDLGMMAPRAVARIGFDHPGLIVVHCNRHPKEEAFVLVVPSGPTTVPADDGSFVLARVPAGRQRIVAWTPRSRPVVKTVDIPEGGSVELDIVLTETLVLGPHPNKYGGDYPP